MTLGVVETMVDEVVGREVELQFGSRAVAEPREAPGLGNVRGQWSSLEQKVLQHGSQLLGIDQRDGFQAGVNQRHDRVVLETFADARQVMDDGNVH